jgi:DNA-binding transcriptional ArsR family regulator
MGSLKRQKSRLTCNHLVAYNDSMVTDEDKVFKALADSSRRGLLDRLRKKSGLTLGELCEGHDMSRQAVTKHLALLEEANLVVTQKNGREKRHYLNPMPISEIYARWIGKFEQGRVAALQNLKQALEENDKGE